MPPVSAQYSIILRVEIDHRPGMLGPRRHRHRRRRREHRLGRPGRDRRRPHAARHHGRHRRRGARGSGSPRRSTPSTARALIDTTDRTFLAARRRQDRAAQQARRPHARRPHAWPTRPASRASARAIAAGPRQGLPVHDQAQHRRRRVRRQRRARPRRHRPGGGDAGDGGQGGPVQGVRRRRRVPDLPDHQGPRRDRAQTVTYIAPGFGGINLEDISAPRCFEIEERLKRDARHPGLPRRPARHRRRHARRAAERAPS